MHLKRHEEDRLIHQAIQGDTQAFNDLVQAYSRFVTGTIRSITKLTEHDVQDIAQNVWEYAWTKISTFSFEKGRSFSSWLRIWITISIKRWFNNPGSQSNWPDDDAIEMTGMMDHGYDSIEQEEGFRIALELIFRIGGYPWQVICFGFNVLLPDWTPQSIVNRLGNGYTLKQLAQNLEEEYIAEMGISSEHAPLIRRCFLPLHAQLNQTLNQLVKVNDYSTRDRFQKNNLGMTPTGQTRLSDYWGSRPAHNVSDWTNKVGKRVKKELAGRI